MELISQTVIVGTVLQLRFKMFIHALHQLYTI